MSTSRAPHETATALSDVEPFDPQLRPAAVWGSGDRSGGRRAMRVLIAEDEFLVGVQLEEDLRAAGCSIIGPFSTLEMATQASRREPFDLAILDINLNGRMVYPLADELSARGVPFIFVSGYISPDLPERFREAPQIAKPYDAAVLIKEIRAAVPKTA